ncbi:LytTr DNA-binding domain-containing protein [Mucilaginibacter pineti]|uniref:LytTr DNA-binding domain-containing protein n=1 Tax=Mucilaginibacter pineti TaxID=1391627 RepID=A0A1G7GGI2_9SPHI|nr:LytTR family DNA-binding domain-containing protein [Mucilaginibacter pineti]SDE87272.1 LytTr DNA-binding domain-containing protein [Mucilaginibacter pineti]
MQEAALSYTSPIAYKDLYLRLIVCIIATHIVIVYGETQSTFEILLTPEYYYAFTGSFIIAFLLFGSVRYIVIKLDKKFDWMQQPVYRTGLQLFFGLMIPGFLAFLLAALYFRLNGVNILDTSYLRYDFQFILLQILIINCYYIAYYFYERWAQAKEVIDRMDKTTPITNDAVRETFQVSKGAANVLLGMDQIAYCYRKDESNFLRTVTGEDFFISLSLDEVQEQLPERKFFRINRQIIAHRQTCKGFDLLSYGKLKAELHPSFNSDVIISQKRALAFKKWIDQAA